MADDLFRKQTVRWVDAEGRRCKPGTPGATKSVEESRKWYGTVGGKPKALSTDKTVARRMLHQLRAKADLASVGLVDPFEEYRSRPLSEHLDDFLAALRAKGDDARHIAETNRLVRAFLDGVKADFVSDLDLATAQEWLTSLSEPCSLPALPDSTEKFTIADAAALLGIKPDSVAPLVKRRGLPATGNGKTRRLPRSTVETLLADAARGASPETVNHHIRALRSFLRWMVKPARRLPYNPLDGLEIVNADTDRRRLRRELTASELQRLLETTRTSEHVFRGLTGEARFHLYATACGTGFRAGGLAGLTPLCFDLDTPYPTVTLSARTDKSRKGREQPLPTDVADLMRKWLEGKPAGLPLWPGTWASARRAAEMLRIDLAAACIPYSVESPDGPLHADFHALRHTYLTLGGRAGIDLRTLQELAGHSTSTLTEGYTHVRLRDLHGAVERLPAFLPTAKDQQQGQVG